MIRDRLTSAGRLFLLVTSVIWGGFALLRGGRPLNVLPWLFPLGALLLSQRRPVLGGAAALVIAGIGAWFFDAFGTGRNLVLYGAVVPILTGGGLILAGSAGRPASAGKVDDDPPGGGADGADGGAPDHDGAAFLRRVTAWAAHRTEVKGLALIGARARGEGKDDSPWEFLVVCDRPGELAADDGGPASLGRVLPPVDGMTGPTVRIDAPGGAEAFFRLTDGDFPDRNRFVRDGFRILSDPDLRLLGWIRSS